MSTPIACLIGLSFNAYCVDGSPRFGACGDPVALPMTEHHPRQPVNPYGHALDDAARLFYERFGFDASAVDEYHLYLLVNPVKRSPSHAMCQHLKSPGIHACAA